MTITIETTPVDDRGRLLHADDPVAQTCLAVRRLESTLAARDLPPTAITAVRLLTAGPGAGPDLAGIVGEELDRLGVTAAVAVVPTGQFAHPRMLVGLQADVRVALAPNTPTEGTDMYDTATRVAPLGSLGSVRLPGDSGYLEAAQAWNLAVPQRPAAVAVPGTIAEVQQVVRLAAGLGLRIAPQSTGHHAVALTDVDFDDVVLLRLHELTGVTVDPHARTVRVLGGTLWRDVVTAAAPYGLTALHGSTGDVAVAGYVLGGGLSFYAREYGFTTSTVRAIEVVTASGELVRATTADHPDLFWALRGGGGSFGVVVAIELDLLPIPDVVAGMLLWDLDRAPDVLRAWVEWTSSVPETITSNIRLMRFPPLPELPPFLSGRRVVVVDGAVHEDDARAAELLAPLRALEPEIDTFTRIPPEMLLDVHMDPPGPTPAVAAHRMLGALPDRAVAALLAVAGPTADTPLTIAELRHVGGAVAQPQDAALSYLRGEYALLALQIAPTPEVVALGENLTAAAVDALREWSVGGDYPNFAERPADASALFDAPDWQRLVRIRDRYDPQRTWVAAHPVGGR